LILLYYCEKRRSQCDLKRACLGRPREGTLAGAPIGGASSPPGRGALDTSSRLRFAPLPVGASTSGSPGGNARRLCSRSPRCPIGTSSESDAAATEAAGGPAAATPPARTTSSRSNWPPEPRSVASAVAPNVTTMLPVRGAASVRAAAAAGACEREGSGASGGGSDGCGGGANSVTGSGGACGNGAESSPRP
jgi:hypothetical protein